MVLVTSCTPSVGGPDSGGEAYVAMEANSGMVFLSHNMRASRPLGSMSQIAVAAVTFDWAEATGESLAQTVIVPAGAASISGANPMGLLPGDQLALRDALYSMLLGSDVVSEQTIMAFVGYRLQQQRGGGNSVLETFTDEMNKLARALGARNTRFVDTPSSDQSRGTAADMAIISVHAMRNGGFTFYVKQRSRAVSVTRRGQKLSFRVNNTNPVLGQSGVIGLKAGASISGGSAISVCADKSSIVEKLGDGQVRVTPRRMVAIVLGSSQTASRSLGLIQEGWNGYEQWTSTGGQLLPGGSSQEVLSVPQLQ